jgi:hypothetical protein
MLKIRLRKDGRVIETIDAKWTHDITDIASSADEELGPEHHADDWEVVNDAGLSILTRARWSTIKR